MGETVTTGDNNPGQSLAEFIPTVWDTFSDGSGKISAEQLDSMLPSAVKNRMMGCQKSAVRLLVGMHSRSTASVKSFAKLEEHADKRHVTEEVIRSILEQLSFRSETPEEKAARETADARALENFEKLVNTVKGKSVILKPPDGCGGNLDWVDDVESELIDRYAFFRVWSSSIVCSSAGAAPRVLFHKRNAMWFRASRR